MKKPKNTGLALLSIFMSMLLTVSGLVFFDNTIKADAAKTATADDSGDYDFDAELQNFPVSYRAGLTEIHNKYPKWKIYAQNTGLDWKTAVNSESAGSISVIGGMASYLLKSHLHKDYSYGYYTVYDAGGWVHAAPNAVAYFMDPRNFLNPKDVFQFEALSYNSKSHTKSGVEEILRGSFMAGTKVSYLDTSGNTVNTDAYYSDLIMAAGKAAKVSPYYLASKILTEIGATKSGSVTGNYNGYVGYYNFYNIGASDGVDPVSNGLAYASTGSSYSRPWTSPEKSIKGGALWIANGYIAEGQDTEYYQRFNVSPNTTYPLYGHQYMTNIMAAAVQARNTYEAYSEMGMLAYEKVFYIPVFDHMPGENADELATSVTFEATKYPQTAVLNTGNINVRKGPNVNYGSWGVRLPQGTKVKIVGKTESYTKEKGMLSPLQYIIDPYWAKVEFSYNGKDYSGDCYISLTYLDIDKIVKISSTVNSTLKYTLDPAVKKDKPYFTTAYSNDIALSTTGAVRSKSVNSGIVIARTVGKGIDLVTVRGSADPEGITISDKSLEMYTGEYARLTATATPEGCNYGSYVWSTSDKSVVKVNSSGKLCAIGAGTATVSVAITNEAFDGSASCKITVKDIGTPKITGYKNTSSSTAVLSWDKVGGAEGYRLYRYNTDTKKYTKIATLSGEDKLSYRVKNLDCGSTYYFAIRAYRKLNDTVIWSDISANRKVKAIPVAPSISSVKAVNDETISVKWNTLSDVTGYELYRAVETDGSYSFLKRITSNTVDYFSNVSLTPSTVYYYKIRSYKTVDKKRIYSAFSSPVSGITNNMEVLTEHITTSSLNYRSGAGTSYPVKGTLAANVKVNVVNGFSENADGYTWYKIKIDSAYYYCVKTYLKSAEVLMDYYTTETVNYRNGPGTTYETKGTIRANKKVKVVKNYSQTANGYTWFKIKLDSDYYFCVKDFLTTQKPDTGTSSGGTSNEVLVVYVTTTEVNYRSGAGTGYAVKGTLASGKSVNVVKGFSQTANGYKWYKIKIGTSYYYCVSEFLKEKSSSGGSTGGSTGETSEKLVSYTTTDSLNYRSGAGTSYAVKGTLSKGKTVNVVDGYSKSANGYTWYKIKIDNVYYYCVKDYLQLSSSNSTTTTEKLVKYKTTAELNYRSGAGTSYSIKGTLAKDKTVNVVYGYSKSANGYKWYKIKIGTSYYYCVSDFLTKVG